MGLPARAEEIAAVDKPSLPKQVQTILDWWLPRVRDILGSNVQSVMLFGGVTLGDFAPAWSDVDVCVVLREPVTQEQGERIGRLHDQMLERFARQGHDGWRSGQVIEGPYVPATVAADPSSTAICYVAGGTTRKFVDGDPLSAFDWYMLAHHGMCCFGAPVRFAPPDRPDLKAQLRQDLASLVSPNQAQLDSSIWLASMIHWIARSIVFWRDGVMMSKRAALKQEIESGSPFAEQFKLALRFHREGSAATRDHLAELRENFLAIAQPAADMMNQLVDQ